eukprot:5241218-Ditylum_brightwellii.AAC.1
MDKNDVIKSTKGIFVIRDVGSAGGTFIRIPPNKGTVLREGMMIMIGKHQLVAVKPEDATTLPKERRRKKKQSKMEETDVLTPTTTAAVEN